VQTHDLRPLSLSIDQQGDHLFQRQCAGADPFAMIRSKRCDLGAYQGVSPDQNISLTNALSGTKGEQVCRTRTSPNKTNGLS